MLISTAYIAGVDCLPSSSSVVRSVIQSHFLSPHRGKTAVKRLCMCKRSYGQVAGLVRANLSYWNYKQPQKPVRNEIFKSQNIFDKAQSRMVNRQDTLA